MRESHLTGTAAPEIAWERSPLAALAAEFRNGFCAAHADGMLQSDSWLCTSAIVYLRFPQIADFACSASDSVLR
jgi:hypothetical protein